MAAALVFTADVGAPRLWAARYLRRNGSSRPIGPLNRGSMATALISLWLEQVCELILVADAWLAAP